MSGSSITGLGIRNKAKSALPGSNNDKPKEGLRSRGTNHVAGWVGKGKDPLRDGLEHESRPLSTLKDPSAFGPPPKNVNYHGGAAMPNKTTPDTSGLGRPLAGSEIALQKKKAQQELEEMEAAPRLPYRADTTGLSTASLPPPPRRIDTPDSLLGSPTPAASNAPKLPPRLPPRQSSSPSAGSPASQMSPTIGGQNFSKGMINQDAVNRLGTAGISVKAFGIGNSKTPEAAKSLPPPLPSRTATAPATTLSNSSQLNELQSRFSHLSPPSATHSDTPSEGTTFAQKQAAMKTVSSFRKDPTSVSFSDAKSAASTAHNFQRRHGEQMQSSYQSANHLNTKYGISAKVNSTTGAEIPQLPGAVRTTAVSPSDTAELPVKPNLSMAGKKPAPPPPKKRPDLMAASSSKESLPPPIPLSSRPGAS